MRVAPIALTVLVVAGVGAWWFHPQLSAKLATLTGSAPAQGQRAASAQRPPAPVEVVTAATGRVADQVEALGTLAADESIAVAAEVAGRIVAFHFREGEPVQKGALLVELDATIARAELTQAQASLSLAQESFERNQTLVQRGAGTQVNLEQATAQLATARASVATSEARLEKLSLYAPFAGVIGLRSVSIGTIVQPGQAIATLASIDPVKVDFGVPELFLSSVRVEQAVDIVVDAVPGRTFTGRVFAIDPVVDQAGRALRLRATIPNTDSVLRPGLFARVNLTTGVREDAVLLPEATLVTATTGQGQAVYVVRDDKASLVNVRIGRRRDGQVEIVDGVAPGDRIVVAGQPGLRDGATVAIAPARERRESIRPAATLSEQARREAAAKPAR